MANDTFSDQESQMSWFLGLTCRHQFKSDLRPWDAVTLLLHCWQVHKIQEQDISFPIQQVLIPLIIVDFISSALSFLRSCLRLLHPRPERLLKQRGENVFHIMQLETTSKCDRCRSFAEIMPSGFGDGALPAKIADISALALEAELMNCKTEESIRTSDSVGEACDATNICTVPSTSGLSLGSRRTE
ncbi:hypothetical protein AC578_1052 [Pseudocercospora eumusae]|uniref:Uncharacterized protein n=1 Tax=Pseudocercospora eumusae TaxID=321146 RepID=A0A139HU29_9PEZI|nr:hypothetical protein AC578_1052 [Pseudocercospora eumusae]